eukprot:Rmarinus@m.703
MALVRLFAGALLALSAHAFPVKSTESLSSYLARREMLVSLDQKTRFSSHVTLTEEENYVNDLLGSLRAADEAADVGSSLTEKSFYDTRDTLRHSDSYKLLQSMPKGGMLHVHYEALDDLDWLIGMSTYDDDCYMYVPAADDNDDGSTLAGSLKYAHESAVQEGDGWVRVNDLRALSPLPAEEFDQRLHDAVTITSDTCCDYETAWDKFEQTFVRLNLLLRYKPIFTEFFRHSFEMLLTEENIQYIEIRTGLDPYYTITDQGESVFATQEETLKLIHQVAEEVKKEYANFIGVKIIYQAVRFIDEPTLRSELDKAVALRDKYPSLVVAFDLVGNEDRGYSLLEYIEPLLEYKGRIPYAFHAGETFDAYGASDNLYDALLLETHRIGHGYAVSRHPLLTDLIEKIPAGIVVCPVSNQVLGLTENLRNHPIVEMMAAGLPLTLSADDPGVFVSRFTDDYWMAYYAWTLDLRDLKALVFGSLDYSFLSPGPELDDARAKLTDAWDTWVQSIAAAAAAH